MNVFMQMNHSSPEDKHFGKEPSFMPDGRKPIAKTHAETGGIGKLFGLAVLIFAALIIAGVSLLSCGAGTETNQSDDPQLSKFYDIVAHDLERSDHSDVKQAVRFPTVVLDPSGMPSGVLKHCEGDTLVYSWDGNIKEASSHPACRR